MKSTSFLLRCARSFSMGATVVLVLPIAAELARSQPPEQAASPEALVARIDELILQLDADRFQVREEAQDELTTIGQPALAKLTAALKDSAVERRRRAAEILERIRLRELNLRHVFTLHRSDLYGAVSAAVSADGKFLYVPAYRTSTVHVFRRDLETGSLEWVQTLMDRDQMQGAVCLRLSPNDKLAISSHLFTKTVVLMTRDAERGTLTVADVVRNDPAAGVTLEWPTDAAFSPDSRFVYVIDDKDAAVVVFEVTDERKLKFVESFTGQDRCLAGARGIAMHPQGTAIFVVSTSGHLSNLPRDAKTGRLSLCQIVKDEQDGAHGLAGVYGVACSPDGRFVYTCAGKEGGDNAITAFQLEGERLQLLQEFLNDKSDLRGYNVANEIVVTPDGRNVYASGTASGSLACFDRDPATGKLAYQATLKNEGTGASVEKGATGLGCSPDGKFLYVTIDDGRAVTVFARKSRAEQPGTGNALRPRVLPGTK